MIRNKQISGIYKISNKLNGMKYIGSSTDCYRRASQHFSNLDDGKHHNKYLQNSYNLYGKEFFSFEIIEEVFRPKSIKTSQFQKMFLFPKEEEIISQYDFNTLYNSRNTATGYTHQMNSTDIRKKARVSRENNKPIFYSYNHTGLLIGKYKLGIDVSDGFKYKFIDNDIIYKGYIWSYRKLKKYEVENIYLNILSSNGLKAIYNYLYTYFGVEKKIISKNGLKIGRKVSRNCIIGYNKNGDRFEFKSIKEACNHIEISYGTLIGCLSKRVQTYNGLSSTSYICKSISWRYNEHSYEDALNDFKLDSEQKIYNKNKQNKSFS